MKINKELLNTKLTRQGVQNQRARLANLSSKCGLLLEGMINRAMLCEVCRGEHDPGKTLTKVDLDAIKLVYSKTLPDISPEDMDEATNEHQSIEAQMRSLANLLDQPTISRLVQHERARAKEIHKSLGDLLNSNVVLISKESA